MTLNEAVETAHKLLLLHVTPTWVEFTPSGEGTPRLTPKARRLRDAIAAEILNAYYRGKDAGRDGIKGEDS